MPTLYVATQGARVSREAERLIVSFNHDKLADVPIRQVDLVILFGRIEITTPAFELCMSRKIDVSFLTLSGKPKGRAQGRISQHVELRRAQYAHYDALRAGTGSEHSIETPDISTPDIGTRTLDVCRAIVAGKIANGLVVVRRAARYRSEEHTSELQSHSFTSYAVFCLK